LAKLYFAPTIVGTYESGVVASIALGRGLKRIAYSAAIERVGFARYLVNILVTY
jgi:hypothetical protein